MTSGSLWNYYKDEIDDVYDNASDGNSFNYKTKIVGNTLERLLQPKRHCTYHQIQIDLNQNDYHDHHNHHYQL